MKRRWRRYAAKVDALPQRERALVFVTVMAAVIFVAYALFIDPLVARKKALAAQAVQQQAELQVMRGNIQALKNRLAAPDAANLARRDAVQRQIVEIDVKLKDMQTSLVPAQTMRAVLQEMLARNPRLQLIAVQTLPVMPLIEKRDKTEKSPAARQPNLKPTTAENGVFKHGVHITLQGSYADMYDYLARLETLPWHMFWSRASLSAADYPRLTMTVTIYTLSLDKAWLVV
jgi:MSHA biogenesis protein MshJ